MSIAELRRSLRPGTRFTAQYIGPLSQGAELREVVSCGSYQMVSRRLEGPKQGKAVYLPWRGIKAHAEGESVILADDADPFLKITFSNI